MPQQPQAPAAQVPAAAPSLSDPALLRAQQTLAAHGQPSDPLAAAAMLDVLKGARGGSRFIGPNGSPQAADHLAAGGSYGQQGQALPPGWQVSQPLGVQGGLDQRGVPLTGAGLAATMTKALAEATPSAGGVLVPVEVSNEIVGMIRQRVAVMRLGPTIVPVEKELDLPYLSTGSAAYYVQENARIPVSEPTFALIPKLRPIELAALVPVSNRLLRDAQTNPSLEEALRNDMADSLAGRQDLSFLQGLGGGAEPLPDVTRGRPGLAGVLIGGAAEARHRGAVGKTPANWRGADRNRTGVHGFAGRCVATPPPRRGAARES